MVGINIRHDSNIRILFEKRTVAFIGFCNNIFSFAQNGVAVQIIDFTANNQCRVCTAFFKHLPQHRRCGRLAVRTGYGNALSPAHDMYQRIRPVDNRNMPAACFHDFRIGVPDSRRHDYYLGILQIFCTLPNANTRSFFYKPVCNHRLLNIRTGNMVSFFYKNIGNGPHACTGYAYKMNILNCI